MPDLFSATPELLEANLFGERPGAEVLMATSEGEPAGVAVYFPIFSTFLGRPGCYLEDLYVRERFRGRGLGEALLRHVARIAKDRGCARFEWLALDWNESAIGFYRKLGAVPLSEWTVYRVTGEALSRLAETPQPPDS